VFISHQKGDSHTNGGVQTMPKTHSINSKHHSVSKCRYPSKLECMCVKKKYFNKSDLLLMCDVVKLCLAFIATEDTIFGNGDIIFYLAKSGVCSCTP
jgi:hypothetical protein